MSRLLYREDIDQVRARLTEWWDGGGIGRPCMQITAPREAPSVAEAVSSPQPSAPLPSMAPHWLSREATERRVRRAGEQCARTHYLGESLPVGSLYVAPGMLSLMLGCRAKVQSGTIWLEPGIENPENASLQFDGDDPYWSFLQELAKDMKRAGEGKFLTGLTSLHEGLDVLAELRGPERMLLDLFDRPDWVHDALDRITDAFFSAYDPLYEITQDETGGSFYLAWAPGRLHRLQCDISAAISPELFGEFMVPVLNRMCPRFSHSIYHWDGPAALRHHDHLLSIESLDALQWTPGAGVEPAGHSRWWPIYHKTVDAGKRMLIELSDAEELKALKREFGEKLAAFLIDMRARSFREARELMEIGG